MNTPNDTISSATLEAMIQEAYENYVYPLVLLSSIILPFYAALIRLSQEVEHIWLKAFSLPALLYVFTRYASLISQGITFWIAFSSLGRSCNTLANITNALSIIDYIGSRGLLLIRAYSICKGDKVLVAALAPGFLSFLAFLALTLYGTIVFSGCMVSESAALTLNNVLNDIFNIFLDVLLFVICVWKVWSIWRLKHGSSRFQTDNKSLVSVLLTQNILRFCFVVTTNSASAIILLLNTSRLIAGSFITMQNTLSSILVANFTLDLRRLNSAKIDENNMSLPSLHLSNILQHVHQSFIVELATPEAGERDAGEDYDHDNMPETMDDNRSAANVN